MTKQEAIDFIKKCVGKPYGFFVVAISEEDVDAYCEGDVKEHFESLSATDKKDWLSAVAGELDDLYNERTFGEDFTTTTADFYND